MKEDGSKYFGEGYTFQPGKDEFIRKGKAGYIVAYGDMLYRSLDAVEKMRKEGIDVGLVNKATLNVVDEAAMKEIGATKVVLVAESLNQRTGLGSKVSLDSIVFSSPTRSSPEDSTSIQGKKALEERTG